MLRLALIILIKLVDSLEEMIKSLHIVFIDSSLHRNININIFLSLVGILEWLVDCKIKVRKWFGSSIKLEVLQHVIVRTYISKRIKKNE